MDLNQLIGLSMMVLGVLGFGVLYLLSKGRKPAV
jgi:hypothetical protein